MARNYNFPRRKLPQQRKPRLTHRLRTPAQYRYRRPRSYENLTIGSPEDQGAEQEEFIAKDLPSIDETETQIQEASEQRHTRELQNAFDESEHLPEPKPTEELEEPSLEHQLKTSDDEQVTFDEPKSIESEEEQIETLNTRDLETEDVELSELKPIELSDSETEIQDEHKAIEAELEGIEDHKFQAEDHDVSEELQHKAPEDVEYSGIEPLRAIETETDEDYKPPRIEELQEEQLEHKFDFEDYDSEELNRELLSGIQQRLSLELDADLDTPKIDSHLEDVEEFIQEARYSTMQSKIASNNAKWERSLYGRSGNRYGSRAASL